MLAGRSSRQKKHPNRNHWGTKMPEAPRPPRSKRSAAPAGDETKECRGCQKLMSSSAEDGCCPAAIRLLCSSNPVLAIRRHRCLRTENIEPDLPAVCWQCSILLRYPVDYIPSTAMRTMRIDLRKFSVLVSSMVSSYWVVFP